MVRSILFSTLILIGACANKPLDVKTQAEATSAIEQTRSELQAAQKIDALTQEIHFEAGSSELSGKDKRALDRIASELKAQSEAFTRLRITGFTDPMGNSTDNLHLSQARANSVRQYLVSRGVPVEKLDAVGMGPASAGLDGLSKEQLAKDRRVQFEIVE